MKPATPLSPLRGPRALPLLAGLAVLVCALLSALAASAQSGATDDASSISLEDETRGAVSYNLFSEDGDLDAILRRGILRVLVSYDSNNFYVENGEVRGFEAELATAFARWLDSKGGKSGKGRPPLRVIFVPVPFDSLPTALEQGMGDIAAAALTVTPKRALRVAFSRPYLDDVDEVVVVRRDEPSPPTTVEGLAGRTVHVVKASSFAENLHALNRRLYAAGKPLVNIVEAGNDLQTEDLLDLLDTKAIDTVIADSFQAKFWSGVLPGIRVLDVAISRKDSIAWAMERRDKNLKRAADEFFAKEDGPSRRISGPLLKRYYGPGRRLPDIAHDVLIARIRSLRPHFTAYGDKHDLDADFLLAQGIQESRLDQAAISHTGAVGVMQVLPSTASYLGIGRVRESAEQNIHAGAAYMRRVMQDYFADPAIADEDRLYFALAAYNVGPNRLAKLRDVAATMNLDPNRWAGNVEWAAMRKVGPGPGTYVTNITKYHLLLSRLRDILPARELGLEEKPAAPAPAP